MHFVFEKFINIDNKFFGNLLAVTSKDIIYKDEKMIIKPENHFTQIDVDAIRLYYIEPPNTFKNQINSKLNT